MKQSSVCFYCFQEPIYHDVHRSLCAQHFVLSHPELQEIHQQLQAQDPSTYFQSILQQANKKEFILDDYHIANTITKVFKQNDDLLQFKKTELKSNCPHVPALKPTAPFKLANNLVICNECQLSSNLWCCLACGYVGCGRDQVGIKGNSHMLDHFSKTDHPLVVKLTSLSAEDYDVYCYKCDDNCAIPSLYEKVQTIFSTNKFDFATFLSNQKSEQTLYELELKQNLSIQFNLSGVPFKNVGFVGLTNIGNSCYINSVVQALNVYLTWQLRNVIGIDITPGAINALKAKLNKLFDAQNDSISLRLLQQVVYQYDGYYLDSNHKNEVTINNQTHAVDASQDTSMIGLNLICLKKQFALKYPLFNNMHQQDAQEFLLFLLESLQNVPEFDINLKLLDFTKCDLFESVLVNEHYKSTTILKSSTSISLITQQSGDLTTIWQNNWTEDLGGNALKVLKFKSIPWLLIIQVHRVDERGNKLVDVGVNAPLLLDVAPFLNSADSSKMALNSDFDRSQLLVNQNDLEMMVGMGIEKALAVKALTANKNLEQAIQMVFDGNVSNDGGNDSKVNNIVDMGFTSDQAKHALQMAVIF